MVISPNWKLQNLKIPSSGTYFCTTPPYYPRIFFFTAVSYISSSYVNPLLTLSLKQCHYIMSKSRVSYNPIPVLKQQQQVAEK